ncbi:MAG: hypothetical protein KDA45_15455, partial [Planctomycetales bacterium]|nr:hypothetical protein [Planctomycetales bacterium]
MENENINKSWETAIRLFYRPQLVLQGTVEYAMAWSFTRRWWLILLLYSPMLLLVLGMAGLVTYGWASKPKALVERYNEWVAEELPAALQEVDGPADDAASDTADEQPPAGSPPSGTVAAGATEDGAEVSRETAEGGPSGGKSQNLADVKEVSRLGELLLRRLLQLEEANSRATYLVAVQLARQGRVGQA